MTFEHVPPRSAYNSGGTDWTTVGFMSWLQYLETGFPTVGIRRAAARMLVVNRLRAAKQMVTMLLAINSAHRKALERERQVVQAECERLAETVGMGGPMAALVARLQARQTRLAELDAALQAEAGERRQVETRAGWERRVRAKLADVRRLLRSDLEEARNVLRTLLVGPLRFTPATEERRRGYRFEGAIALDRLVSGVARSSGTA